MTLTTESRRHHTSRALFYYYSHLRLAAAYHINYLTGQFREYE